MDEKPKDTSPSRDNQFANRIITTLIDSTLKSETLFGAYFMNRNHKTTTHPIKKSTGHKM
jgi:hypothetical protein